MVWNKRFTSILKKCDMHGHQIGLTYKQKQYHQTSIGGIVTILSRLGILAYFLVLLLRIVDREKKVTFKQTYMSANKDSQIYPLRYDNFDLAVSFQFSDGQLHTNEKNNIQRYMKFEYSHSDSTWNFSADGQKIVKRKQTIVGSTKCNNTRFSGLNDTINDLGIANGGWHCIKDLGFDLKGQYPSFTRTLMKLRIVPCSNSSTIDNVTCAPQEEIDSLIKVTIINVAVLTSYFQQDDFTDQPVKKDINTFIYNIKQGQGFTQIMDLKKFTLTTKDYWFSSYLGNQKEEFYQVNEKKIMVGEIKPNSMDMFTMLFYCAQEEVFIERQVLTFTEILATLGGLSSIIMLLTRQVSRLYAKTLFESSIIQKLYRVQSQELQPSKIYLSSRHQSLVSLDNLQSLRDSQSKISTLWAMLISRQKLNFSIVKHYLRKILTCFKINQEIRNHKKKLLQFKNGQVLLNKQLDIVKVLKQIRLIKILSKILLSNYQYQMVKFSSQNLIPSQNMSFKLTRSYNTAKKMKEVPLDKNYSYLNKLFRIRSDVNARLIKDLRQSLGEQKYLIDDSLMGSQSALEQPQIDSSKSLNQSDEQFAFQAPQRIMKKDFISQADSLLQIPDQGQHEEKKESRKKQTKKSIRNDTPRYRNKIEAKVNTKKSIKQ